MTSFTDATTWGRRGQAPPSPKLHYVPRGRRYLPPFGEFVELCVKSALKVPERSVPIYLLSIASISCSGAVMGLRW